MFSAAAAKPVNRSSVRDSIDPPFAVRHALYVSPSRIRPDHCFVDGLCRELLVAEGRCKRAVDRLPGSTIEILEVVRWSGMCDRKRVGDCVHIERTNNSGMRFRAHAQSLRAVGSEARYGLERNGTNRCSG